MQHHWLAIGIDNLVAAGAQPFEFVLVGAWTDRTFIVVFGTRANAAEQTYQK
jgi:hypothetical protein